MVLFSFLFLGGALPGFYIMTCFIIVIIIIFIQLSSLLLSLLLTCFLVYGSVCFFQGSYVVLWCFPVFLFVLCCLYGFWVMLSYFCGSCFLE